jgi:transposase
VNVEADERLNLRHDDPSWLAGPAVRRRAGRDPGGPEGHVIRPAPADGAAAAFADETLAEAAAARAKTEVAAVERRKPVRKPLPEPPPRERAELPAPCACSACAPARLVKMGEDVAETLEVAPRQVIRTVRETFARRGCERVGQPPAPFHPAPRGWAGPGLPAMIVFETHGRRRPLNRQAERHAREGVEPGLSTPAGQAGAVAAAPAPPHALIEAHVMAAGRLHGPSRRLKAIACRATDDAPAPLLARGKAETARLWTCVRDDRPCGGPASPAALFRFPRDRRGAHPQRRLERRQGPLPAPQRTSMRASTACSARRAGRGRSRPRSVGRMRDASRSSAPTSPRTPGGAGRRRRSRRSRSKRRSASTPSSAPSAPSTVGLPSSASPCDRPRSRRRSRSSTPG